MISFKDMRKESKTPELPKELKELCISPDPANRKLAACQLPNYNRTDKFFADWGGLLANSSLQKIKTIGERILKWTQGGRVHSKKAFTAALEIGVVHEDNVYLFATDEEEICGLVGANIHNGKFQRKFAIVNGDFNCRRMDLTSLEGSPEKVTGNFNCSSIGLESLEGGPQEVGGDFKCYNNFNKNLVGGPVKVGGDYVCTACELTSLEGAPQEVGGSFQCNGNQITSLVGGPQKVGKNYNCANTCIDSLEGAPKELPGWFDCSRTKLGMTVEEVGEKIKASVIYV